MRPVQDKSRSSEHAVPPAARKSRPDDVRGLSDALVRAFEFRQDADTAQQERNVSNPDTVRKTIKIAIAAGLAIVLGWKPLIATLAVSSAEAFVNTTAVTVRAPIDGLVENFTGRMRLGASVAPGDELFRISEPLADHARVLDVERSLNRARLDRDAMAKRIGAVGSLKADLDRQVEAFRTNRIRQVQERLGEVREKIDAAVAIQHEASTGVARNARLNAAGLARDGGLARSIRDETVATRSIGELKHQAAALQVELNALNAGQFVGDSFNDRPQSAQRSEQLQQSIAEMSIDLEAKGAEIKNLADELSAEKDRLARLSTTTMRTPNGGVVWEVLTAPGERVVRGQELMRILDCSQSIVSAAVEENVYNRIRLGEAVTFRLRGESIDRPGTIVRLSGLASAPANLAISPGTLLKAPYRAAISVPSLARDGACGIGRTGKVTFEVGKLDRTALPTTP